MPTERVPGIPGSVSKEAARIRWRLCRSGVGIVAGVKAKFYEAFTEDGMLKAIVAREPIGGHDCRQLLWHLSVSFRDKAGALTRCPTWDELKSAKYQLMPVDVEMVVVFPRKNAKQPYLNDHATTLHLFEYEAECVGASLLPVQVLEVEADRERLATPDSGGK